MSVRDIVMSAAGQGGENLYVEDVFQTWLRTGTGADVTVTNNVDMTEGYMLWTKGRSGATDHAVYDSERGVTKDLVTNSTAAETTQSTGLKAVSSTGYTIGSLAKMNTSGATYADWVFRKAKKFFDVVTYTGDGVAGRTVAHNLGSVPGMIIVKRTNGVSDWNCWHRSISTGDLTLNTLIQLNTTSAASGAVNQMGVVSSTSFEIGSSASFNASGTTYVAYLFAHDAGGFGDTGDESIVACGEFSGTGFVNLGWEPQWILIKPYTQTFNWQMYDNMRGMGQPDGLSAGRSLIPNLSNVEANSAGISFEANGFTQTSFGSTFPCIYLAIRRGPMKTPESGTEVFSPNITSNDENPITTGFAVDMLMGGLRSGNSLNFPTFDRVRGSTQYLRTASTAAEANGGQPQRLQSNTSVTPFFFSNLNTVWWSFRRAPGFFDVVCYTGDGTDNRAVTHGLESTPEFFIVKRRNNIKNWFCWHQSFTAPSYILLDSTGAVNSLGAPDSTFPTAPNSSSFFVNSAFDNVNGAGSTYVAYLFATLAGVSKVGSYTGNGSSQTINCGFTTGARFVMIKRIDSTGNWVTFDTARGITSSSDPALYLNSTAAEVTGVDGIDPLASGFTVNQEGTFNLNVSSASYIFLAIS